MQTYFDSASAKRATENDRAIAQMSATQQQLYQNFQTNQNTHNSSMVTSFQTHMQDTQQKVITAVQSAVQSQNETHRPANAHSAPNRPANDPKQTTAY
jgi:hypothetical protein